jgi:hypothetical protein
MGPGTYNIVCLAILKFAEEYMATLLYLKEANMLPTPYRILAVLCFLVAAALHVMFNQFDSTAGAEILRYLSDYFYFKGGQCARCQSPASLKCSKCCLARYCSAECQKEMWPIHKKQCGKLSEAELNDLFFGREVFWPTVQLYKRPNQPKDILFFTVPEKFSIVGDFSITVTIPKDFTHFDGVAPE